MPDQVKVPGAGKVNKTWLYTGLAAIAGIVVYAYWRRASDTPAPGEGEATVGDQWSPDAFTGAGTPAPGGETYDPNEVTTRFDMPTTNAEWTQRVIEALAGTGTDITFAAATIGKYLSGQVLNAAEKIVAQTGIAMMGNPPAGALPILSGPEASAPKPPPKFGYGGWHGVRVGTDVPANITLIALAGMYANHPSEPNSVEQVKREILLHNPFLAIQKKNRNTSTLPRGWVIIVPKKG